MEYEIIRSEVREAVGDVFGLVENVALSITCHNSRAVAVELGKKLHAVDKRIKAMRVEQYEPEKKRLDELRATFDDPLREVKACKTVVANAITNYDIEQERIRRIEHEKMLGEQKRQQEEIARLKIQAEKERQDEYEKRVREEEQARLAQAEQAEKEGDSARAMSILSRQTAIAPAEVAPSMPMPIVQVPSEFPSDDGAIKKDRRKFDVSSMPDLVTAIVECRAPLRYVMLNRTEVGKDFREQGSEFHCPGIRVWIERSTSFR